MKMQVKMITSLETAKVYVAEHCIKATVEAEYGDYCVGGKEYTLAHHGARSMNPAPCNWELPVSGVLQNDDEIVVSHIDLDTIGGVLALYGIKPHDKDFWSGAEFIDVHGPQHMRELPEAVQRKLNAYWAWTKTLPREANVAPGEIRDVTETVMLHAEALAKIVAGDEQLLANGDEWATKIMDETDARCVYESALVRSFVTEDVFCNSSYYSRKLGQTVPATVAYNRTRKAITIAFFDGGKTVNACQIAQQLWGSQAGGHPGIAGSGRGEELDESELERARIAVEKALAADATATVTKTK